MATVSCGTDGSRALTSLALASAYVDGLNTLGSPEVIEFYNDGVLSGKLDLTGCTPDATNTLTLRCASGQSHKDHANKATNARRCDQSYGVMIDFSGGFDFGLDAAYTPYVIIDGLQVKGSAGFCGAITRVAPTAVVKDCIFENQRGIYALLRGKFVNCLFIQLDTYAQPYSFEVIGGTPELHGCAFVMPSDIDGTGVDLVRSAYGSIVMTNCAVFGTNINAVSGTPTATTCMSNDASVPSGFTTVTYADQFENTTTASRDFRPKAGADLIDAGSVDSGYATDLIGQSRPQGAGWDVGAEEWVSPIPPAYARPASDVSDGGWTNEAGSGASLYASIDETAANPTDFIQSAVLAPGGSDTCEVALGPLADPGVHTDHKVNYQYFKRAAEGVLRMDLTVSLVEGTTVIASQLVQNIATGLVTGALTLSAGEAAAIGDYTNLRLRFTAQARV